MRFANTLLIHDWLMYVAVILFAGHLYLSLVHRPTGHSLNAITRGWVTEDWARVRHAKWADQPKAGQPLVDKGEPPGD